MFQSILTQSTSQVYEYSLTVVDPTNNDSQKLVAAFSSIPTLQDWQQWLSGWNDTGYQLQLQPQLIRTI